MFDLKQKIIDIKKTIKVFFNNFTFLKIYFSPFKTIIPKLYIGEIAIGTPYYFPRKWVLDPSGKAYNPIPKKIGFDFVNLGYKTKWSNTDYRYEWSPIWSFILFKYQIALMFVAEEEEVWTCWLIYEKHTDKSLPIKERILQAKEIYPCVWTSFSDKKEIKICYWDIVLKKRYR